MLHLDPTRSRRLVLAGGAVLLLGAIALLVVNNLPGSGAVATQESFDLLKSDRFRAFEMFRNEQTDQLREEYPNRYESGFHRSHYRGSTELRLAHNGPLADGLSIKIVIKYRGADRPTALELQSDLSLIMNALGLDSAVQEVVSALWPETPESHAGSEWETPETPGYSGGIERRGLYWVSIDQLDHKALRQGMTTVECWGRVLSEEMFTLRELDESEYGKLNIW